MTQKTPLKLFAFSEHRFDAPGEAEALVDTLMGAPFGATRHGTAEPVRTPLAGKGRAAAVSALRGAQGTRGGAVFLAGTQPRLTAMMAWRHGQTCTWYAEFDPGMASNTAQCNRLVEALADLFKRFPARYAALAPGHCWKARHWLIEEFEDGGEAHTKMGLDLAGHLPGVFWWTLFGREATAFFGRDVLLALPVVQTIDLGAQAGVVLRTDACPDQYSDGGLSAAELAARDLLGAQYFFDIRDTQRTCAIIPGLTGPST